LGLGMTNVNVIFLFVIISSIAYLNIKQKRAIFCGEREKYRLSEKHKWLRVDPLDMKLIQITDQLTGRIVRSRNHGVRKR
jgi:hypothetical protein